MNIIENKSANKAGNIAPVKATHRTGEAEITDTPSTIPGTGLAGLRENWRTDMVSGLILFLIALPLSLAIAIASGMPPMAGLIAAAVGGILVSRISGSYVVINGPAAGLITVIAGTVARLGGGETGQHCTLAAIVVSGIAIFLFGKFKGGELGDFFPLSVVHGMLASIGIIIMSKQFYIMLGIKPPSPEPLELIGKIPESLANLNPDLAIIGLVSLSILIVHAITKNKKVKAIPVPLLVVAVAIALAQYFGLSHAHHYNWNGHDYELDPSKCLVLLPSNIFSAFVMPDWSQIASSAFWFSVVTIVFVQGLETILSCAAVDNLDPFKRKSDLSKDVEAVGVGTLVSGSIGGLPMIAEIVRSTANIDAGARTSWSNFFHGAFIALFVLTSAQLIDMVPTAALAAILVVTGFRLASPKSFKETYAIGPEQLVFFVITIIAVLKTDLLVGVSTGILTKFVFHLISGVPPGVLFKADVKVSEPRTKEFEVVVCKAAIFSNFPSLKNHLKKIPTGCKITIDLGNCVLVDHTVMERLHQFALDYKATGGRFETVGLEKLRSNSTHPLAARRAFKAS
jgi:MFS superfamily sulfate permease-like transporter